MWTKFYILLLLLLLYISSFVIICISLRNLNKILNLFLGEIILLAASFPTVVSYPLIPLNYMLVIAIIFCISLKMVYIFYSLFGFCCSISNHSKNNVYIYSRFIFFTLTKMGISLSI